MNRRDSSLLVTTRRPIPFVGARIRSQYRVPLRFPLMGWTAFTRRPNTRKSAGFPHGMMSPCGSIPMPPITDDRSLSPRSSIRTSINMTCGMPSQRCFGTCTGLPRSASRICERRGIFLYAGGTYHQRGPIQQRIHPPSYLLVQALNSNLWLALLHGTYGSSPMLSLHPLTLAPHRLLLAALASPHVLSCSGLPFPAGTFPSVSHPRITPDAWDGGFYWLNSRSISGQFRMMRPRVAPIEFVGKELSIALF